MDSLATGDWLTAERVRRIGWISLIVSLAMLAVLAVGAHGTVDARGRPLGTDFSGVWTAGQMALDGRAAEAWDWQAHFSMQRALHGQQVPVFGWHYPPPFLLVATALARLPYLTALIAWQFASFAALAFVATRIVPGRDTLLLVAAAPVTLICATHGHNGFLTGALLGGGLLLLDRRPVVAGLLLGCLLYKPQFGLLVGPLLLATRNWRAFAGACASAAALSGLTLFLWGWSVWVAFFASLPLTREVVIEAGATGFHKIMSPFAAIRLWGGSIALGYLIQSAATLGSILAVVWASLCGRPNARNAVTCAAAVIATPYVMDYDHVVVGVGIAFLVADARVNGWRSWDRSLLALVWITPLVARIAALATGVPLGLGSAVVLLALGLRRIPAPQPTAWPFRRSRAASVQ